MKEEKEILSKTISFRVSNSKYMELAKGLEETSLTVHKIARMCLEGAKVIRPKDEKLNRQKLVILGRYGNNLNQIAHKLNIAAKINPKLDSETITEVLQKMTQLELLIQHDLATEIYERQEGDKQC